MHVNTKVETVRIGGAAAGVIIYGYTLNEWVAIVTLVYLALQIFILCPKAYKTVKDFIGHIKSNKRHTP